MTWCTWRPTTSCWSRGWRSSRMRSIFLEAASSSRRSRSSTHTSSVTWPLQTAHATWWDFEFFPFLQHCFTLRKGKPSWERPLKLWRRNQLIFYSWILTFKFKVSSSWHLNCSPLSTSSYFLWTALLSSQSVNGIASHDEDEINELQEDDRELFSDQLSSIGMLGRVAADHCIPLLTT